MDRENRPLVSDEPVEFEKYLVKAQAIGKNYWSYFEKCRECNWNQFRQTIHDDICSFICKKSHPKSYSDIQYHTTLISYLVQPYTSPAPGSHSPQAGQGSLVVLSKLGGQLKIYASTMDLGNPRVTCNICLKMQSTLVIIANIGLCSFDVLDLIA